MERQIAVFGGSFNPPGKHHRRIAEILAEHFDEVLVVPCGPRPDKPPTQAVAPVHRAVMCALGFAGLDRVTLEPFDLERERFTPTWRLEQRFAGRGRLWHVVGADLVAGGGGGRSEIQRSWQRGRQLWSELRFAVVKRPGHDLDPADLPPQHRVFEAEAEGSSTAVRQRLAAGGAAGEALLPAVAAYVERHRLYRDTSGQAPQQPGPAASLARMKPIRVAAAVLNQTPLDWTGNAERIRAAITQARALGASVLCLPELCISGYGCEDAFLAPHVAETALQVLRELQPETAGMAVSLGLPLIHRRAVLNAACLMVDGRARAFVAKRHLARDGIHYEPRWFRPWPRGARTAIEFDGQPVPLGDVVLDCQGLRIGFEICQDAWMADRPAVDLAGRGVDLILNPSASHFALGKAEVRRRVVQESSRAFGVAYVYANLLGNEAGRAIYDGGALIAAAGRLLAVGHRFSFADVQVTSAVVDLAALRLEHTDAAGIRSGPARATDEPVWVDFAPPAATPGPETPEPPEWEEAADLAAEEFTRAEALGLFDYLRKSRSRGFVVSLSGGADSAACACLVASMVRLAHAELGPALMLAKLPGGERFHGNAGVAELLAGLLTCVYQATANSSRTTRRAAAELAPALGARYHEIDLEPVVQAYVGRIQTAAGRELSWERDDVALQNIQARVRAPSVWLLANLSRSLLLATSNRSEAAVGYATMDGDTCGGLSPIAGIDKAFVRHWLRWMEHSGPVGLEPIPALAAVNAQQPTAELRPPAAGQTDEDDLMPYPVLTAIERAAVRDRRSPLAVFALLEDAFEDHSPLQIGRWVERFFVLWARNQWKRERFAPSFHLDDHNLDPRSWCRFPILSGGYERELGALRQQLRQLEDS